MKLFSGFVHGGGMLNIAGLRRRDKRRGEVISTVVKEIWLGENLMKCSHNRYPDVASMPVKMLYCNFRSSRFVIQVSG